jgi:hypothetical protein
MRCEYCGNKPNGEAGSPTNDEVPDETPCICEKTPSPSLDACPFCGAPAKFECKYDSDYSGYNEDSGEIRRLGIVCDGDCTFEFLIEESYHTTDSDVIALIKTRLAGAWNKRMIARPPVEEEDFIG